MCWTDYPEMKMVAQRTDGELEPDGAFTIWEPFCRRIGYRRCDFRRYHGAGAEAALKAMGKNDVIVVGFDSSDYAPTRYSNGATKATVLQPAGKQPNGRGTGGLFLKKNRKAKRRKQLMDCILIDSGNAKKTQHVQPQASEAREMMRLKQWGRRADGLRRLLLTACTVVDLDEMANQCCLPTRTRNQLRPSHPAAESRNKPGNLEVIDAANNMRWTRLRWKKCAGRLALRPERLCSA